MLYKKYGSTGIDVSAIGMGCMRFADRDILEGKIQKYVDLILYAHEKGINFFDTAPFYCHDKCESIAGMALSQVPRDSYYVTSKTNIKTLGNDCTRDAFFRRLETSLERLKVDYIDFYYLWCMLDLNSFRENCDKLYSYFEEAKSQGMIRHIVMSAHMQGNDLVEAVDTKLFSGIALGYNALNYRYRQSGILAADKLHIGVAVMNPLGGGVIPENPEVFRYLTEGTNFNIAQGGMAFVASHKEVSVAMSGFASEKEIDEAVEVADNITVAPMNEVCSKYNTQGVSLENLCTSCGYCNHCPQGIEIPKLMDSYNDKLLGGSVLKRLRMHWHLSANAALGCLKCGKCERLCTQHLPIMSRIQEIASVVNKVNE